MMRIPYGALITNPWWRRWTLATGLSRVSIAAAPLALVIGGHWATGSFADGAVLAGVYSIAEALAAPRQGRRLDLGERRRGLAHALGGGSVGLAAVMGGILMHAPLVVLIAVTVAAAALPAGVQGGLRAYLPELVGPQHAQAAFVLDASLLEVEWLSAPAVVALAALLGAPWLGVGAMLAATIAALATVRLLPPAPDTPPGANAPSPWRNLAGRRAYLLSAVLGYTEGTITVAIAPLLATLHSRPAYAGLLLAGLSAASALGGFAFGALDSRLPGSEDQQANTLLAGLGLMALPVAFAPTPLAAAVAVAAFGLLIAPLNGLRTRLLSHAAPAAQRAQAFSILYAAMGAGFGVGGLATGALLGLAGVRCAIIVAAAITVVAATATWLGSSRTVPPTTARPAPDDRRSLP